MNWSLFFDLTVSGLTLGSLYSLIALGYSMVYGILKLLNFAHGDVYMIGAFIGWFALHGLGGPSNPTVSGGRFVVFMMFIVAMLGCGVLGVAIERFAYRPLRNAPRIAPLISALGVSIFLQNSALLLFGASFRDYNTFSLIGVKTYNIGRALLLRAATDDGYRGRRPDGRADNLRRSLAARARRCARRRSTVKRRR